MRYAALQERSHLEVRNKLQSWGYYGDELEEIVADLILKDFLNEERFARAYAHGKFVMNHWGRRLIRKGLKQKGISEPCIRMGMEEIDEEEYRQTLVSLLTKYWQKRNDMPMQRKAALVNFAVRKGYEPELCWEIASEIAGF